MRNYEIKPSIAEPENFPGETMETVDSRHRWAVWVIIAFIAIVVSVGVMTLAGKRSLQQDSCVCEGVKPPDLKLTLLRFELNGTICQSPCVRSWAHDQVLADFLFIPSYSVFLALTFLLLSASRFAGDPPAVPAWRKCGIALAVVMAAADVTENLQMLRSLQGGSSPYLRLATMTKWWAVALAVVLAGVLALKRQWGGWRWLMALIGAAGIVVGSILAVSVSLLSIEWVQRDTNWGLPVFFLLILVYAVAVLVRGRSIEKKGGA
jgi:hypothetical protein